MGKISLILLFSLLRLLLQRTAEMIKGQRPHPHLLTFSFHHFTQDHAFDVNRNSKVSLIMAINSKYIQKKCIKLYNMLNLVTL